MITRFRQLATLRITHAYDGGVSRDVDFAIPEETAAALRRGRMLSRVSGGVLCFLYEADAAGQPVVAAAGATLRVGLRPANPSFRNITDPAALPAAGIAYWRNRTVATDLDPMEAREPVGRVFSHALSDPARPVTVTVEDDAAHVLRSETVTAAQGRPAVSFELAGVDPGPLTVREVYPSGPPRTTRYLLHPELAREGLLGAVELAVPASFYTSPSPPAFEIALAARRETLRYYLVVTNYTVADFNQLNVDDTGFAEEQRPKIHFTKVPAGAFGPGELSTSVLGGGPGAQFVLFRSAAPVARQQRARRKIQLLRHNELLVEHLPQPRAEQPDANLILHIAR